MRKALSEMIKETMSDSCQRHCGQDYSDEKYPQTLGNWRKVKKMLESRSEDALVKLVESVEIVESVVTVETVETVEIVEYIPDICHFFLYRHIF